MSISAAADRAVDMTASLLAIGRRQELRPRPLDVNEVISRDEAVLRRLIEPGQTLEITLAPAVPAILADPVRLEQVVLNLVANARAAIGRDGHISIETRVEGVDSDDGQTVWLTVADDGEGVPPDIVDHIFEPFFTSKESGTGLGLATVYGIVAQSGGTIDFTTGTGTGTTFRVRFPVLTAAGSTIAAVAEPG